jgi:hypothetical protein
LVDKFCGCHNNQVIEIVMKSVANYSYEYWLKKFPYSSQHVYHDPCFFMKHKGGSLTDYINIRN